MLETKNLSKRYKPKKGMSVEALKGVSLKFPETGMVFLLGKSGSGKSTLLNLLGGLDKYDGGEIIINGVSSKEFKQKHFDSYRNTYLGFIFQEYNILEEFNVGANIAIAIELQGRKATDEEINKILDEVDLSGYGNRKPNELSGGQKQRVAIARALVKSPKIIMADEPTGALDSATGKMVLDTLRKLSKDKLVIIVSHDREFAEKYADRIIELSDGEVISDLEYDNSDVNDAESLGISFEDKHIFVAKGYHLTEEDRKLINEHLEHMSSELADISLKISSVSDRGFKKTDQSKIKSKNADEFRLIKSRLPLKSTIKIGANGLKYKKIRLCITILLSCIAFGLFGLADTFGSYNHIKTCAKSLLDSDISYALVNKARRIEYDDGYFYYDSYGMRLSEDDLEKIDEATGISMKGVYLPVGSNLYFGYNTSYEDAQYTGFDIYLDCFTGFANVSEDELTKMGYSVLCGEMPDGNKNEIGISATVCETFLKYGYYENSTNENDRKLVEINDYSDMLGRSVELEKEKYVITCVFDTNFDFDRYRDLSEEPDNISTSEQLVRFALYNELSYAEGYSLEQAAIVGDGFIEKKIENVPDLSMVTNYYGFEAEHNGNYISLYPDYVCDLDEVKADDIIWVDGEKTSLGEKEIIVDASMLVNSYYSESGADLDLEGLINELKNLKNSFDYYDDNGNIVEGYTVVGVLTSEDVSGLFVCSNELKEELSDVEGGIYQFAVGNMPESEDEVRRLVSYCYENDDTIKYEMKNAVSYELDMVDSTLNELSKVFFYIGLGFAVFAAIMLANFISTSISYKKQEIGILRAIGARSNDVFKIFFAESLIIASVNFVLSAVGVGVATALINNYFRNSIGIYITILNFGLRQVVLLMLVSAFIALAASFIPVKRIAAKHPIDAIRNR